ncbi:unnamed protein product [Effrenium voratum]|nr:unnamed protein product [Effrenium voratum]
MLLRAAWALLVLAHAAPIRGPRAFGVWRQDSPPGRPSTVNCTWQSFRQQIDHFGSKKGTFPQRVCIYSRWWKDASQSGFNASGSPGPIFFYTGNESPVEQYINNTGLMWELAEKMGALIVFAEHRYEPLSHPRLCGTENCVAYCTTAQALADWAAIIADLRKQHVARAPAVVFGGSYGGMLSGWMRMKYPEVVDGAIAASAPIWQLATTVTKKSLDWPARAVARGVSKPGKAPDRCLANLRVAWPLLEAAGSSQEALELLSQEVNTCRPLKSAKSFTSWAQQPYFLLAEGNYPYPSTYITFAVGPGDIPLPAWPMREACKHLDRDFGVELEGSLSEVRYNATLGDLKVTVDWTHLQSNSAGLTLSRLVSSNLLALARGVANAAGVWYNVSGTKRCWDVEDIVLPRCS